MGIRYYTSNGERTTPKRMVGNRQKLEGPTGNQSVLGHPPRTSTSSRTHAAQTDSKVKCITVAVVYYCNVSIL